MSPGRVLVRLALGALPMVALAAGAVAAAPSAALPIQVGANLNGAPPGEAGLALADRRLAAAGVSVVRILINWSQVEPQPGRYDFSSIDPQISAAHLAGLGVIAILGLGNPLYSPEGALVAPTPLSGGLPPFGEGGATSFPPSDPAPFARYATAVARRYRGRITAYEVWNEENQGFRFWAPHEDPAAYARLLAAAYPAIKGEDPRTPVLFGGVFFPAVPPGLPEQAGDQFLQNAYAADPALGRSFDGVAYHPYPYPFTSPDYDAPARGSVYSAYDAMHAVMAAHGDGQKPLWITEIGWPSSSAYGVSEQKQAQYLVRVLAYSAAQHVHDLTVYTYGDSTDPTDPLAADQEAHFGLFDTGGRPKPAYQALATFTRLLAGTSTATLRHDLGGVDAAVLAVGRRVRVTLLWNAPEGAATDQGSEPAATKTTTASIPLSRGASVRAYTMLGRQAPVAVAGGRAQLRVGDAPVYLVVVSRQAARPLRISPRRTHRSPRRTHRLPGFTG